MSQHDIRRCTIRLYPARRDSRRGSESVERLAGDGVDGGSHLLLWKHHRRDSPGGVQVNRGRGRGRMLGLGV
jgi:hypothetical protein